MKTPEELRDMITQDCPWCKKKNEISIIRVSSSEVAKIGEPHIHIVVCQECGAHSNPDFDIEEAISRWNCFDILPGKKVVSVYSC